MSRIGDFIRDIYLWITGRGGGVPYGARTRTYHFPLPYTLSAVEIMYGVKMLKSNGLWNTLPGDIRERMDFANRKWRSIKVTESDLNKLDDRTWSMIAKKLGLEWS